MEKHDCARRIAPSGVTMRRTAFFLATLVLTSAIPAFAQTTDNTTLLLNRIVTKNGGTAEVFVGKLPTGMPQIPLPAATVVGSVHESISSPIAIDSYDLYYDAAPDTLKTYGETLVAAGWTNSPLPLNFRGGFVSSTGPESAIFCKSDAPLITAQVGTDPKDLRISISRRGGAVDIVCAKNPLTAIANLMKSPLPPLHAPDGVRMSVAQIVLPNNQSAAYIHNGTSASDLLNGFALQLVAAGWHAGSASSGASIVSQPFTKVDDKKALWQCVISIDAVDASPSEFVAFISVANLSALAEGSSTLLSH